MIVYFIGKMIVINKIKNLVISIVSFCVGLFLLYLTFIILWNSNFDSVLKIQTVAEVFPNHFNDWDIRLFVFSLIGGIAFIINGFWYASIVKDND
jgi:hypothetical protein